MYPGVIVEFDDQSNINTLSINEVRNKPLFAALFTSDKGTEQWTRISGRDFFEMYGKNISFSRHGQPLLQAAMSINAGAELLCKRLVSDDAILANLGIIAELGSKEVQATDEDGNLLYQDPEGHNTVEVTETPVMITATTIKYSLETAPAAKTPEEVKTALVGKISSSDHKHLLYAICDNGRGTSKKRIKITPNYRVSKGSDYTSYTLHVIEGAETIETISFAANPNLIVAGKNISMHSMVNTHSKQLHCIDTSENMDGFIAALAKATGIDEATLYTYDPLFACTNRGTKLKEILLDGQGIDLQYEYGQMLQSGTNGALTDTPANNPSEFSKLAVAALNGTFDETIFNVDQYRINAIIDANYPDDVKRAIEALATFREDFVYFRDMGIGMNSIDLIKNKNKTGGVTHNKFCATYCQSYDVIDPYTKRQITVTIGYDLAQLMVMHCNNGANLPTAGMKHNMVITNAIYGTLSFAPSICPDPIGNQKEMLDDLRINYASYIDNRLVIETLYTSQDKHTQWSYINNIMAVQDVIKAIRIRCPAIRYTFIEGEDLEKYKADVEEVIAPFRSNFRHLVLNYVQDAQYSANKIFYAVLEVTHKEFNQTELFKVTALSAANTVEG